MLYLSVFALFCVGFFRAYKSMKLWVNKEWAKLCSEGDSTSVQKAQFLLWMGANINMEINGFTALMSAVESERDEKRDMINFLLKNGADVNVVSGNQRTALKVAVGRKHEEDVKVLLENGADVNAQPGGENALMMAVDHLILCVDEKNINIINVLLNTKKANIFPAPTYTQCALDYAAYLGDGFGYTIVNLLLEKGADVNRESNIEYLEKLVENLENKKIKKPNIVGVLRQKIENLRVPGSLFLPSDELNKRSESPEERSDRPDSPGVGIFGSGTP